jgi:bla regulator protein BlaR1
MKDALALALVHFIWQGAVLALAGAALMRVMKTPAVRYSIGVATLFAMLVAPVITTVAITKAPSGTTFSAVMRPDASSASTQRSTLFEPIALNSLNRDGSASSQGIVIPTTWILNLWTIGVILLSLRFVGGWAMARGLTRQALSPVGEELQALAADMARRLQVRAVVRVCESASMAAGHHIALGSGQFIAARAARSVARPRAGAYPPARLPRQPSADLCGNALLLSPGCLGHLA